MKWSEVKCVPDGFHLVRIGSGRVVELRQKIDWLKLISVRYVDDGTWDQRADPRDFVPFRTEKSDYVRP